MNILKGHPIGTFWHSASNKIGFVNIPKNASTTAKALFRMAYPDATARNIYETMGLHLDDETTFFAFTRDEFDRYISGLVEYEVRNNKDVYKLVKQGIFAFDEHTVPQQWFLYPFTSRIEFIDMYRMYEIGPFAEFHPIPRQNPSKNPTRKVIYHDLFNEDPGLKRLWSMMYESRLL